MAHQMKIAITFLMATQALSIRREPLLANSDHFVTAAPVKKETHPKDYFVPSFGVDNDIKGTQESTSLAESKLSHSW